MNISLFFSETIEFRVLIVVNVAILLYSNENTKNKEKLAMLWVQKYQFVSK